MKKLILATIMSLMALSTHADEIILQNGSIIKGKISKIFQDKLIITTDFSPEITVNFKKIKSFSTDKEQSVKLSDGQQFNGKIAYDGKAISVKGGIAKTTVDAKHFAMLWKKGEKAPDYKAPFKKHWVNTAAIDINKKEGNTDELNLSVQASATLKGEKDSLKLYTKIKRAESDGDKTSDERIAGVDYEYRFTKKNAWYLRLELEKDEFENLDLRTTVAAGYGRYFFDDKVKTLRGRVGTLFRSETYSNDENEETVGLDFGLNYTYLIKDFGNWYTNLTWAPSVEDFGNYRLNHESGLSLPVGSKDRWTVKFGIHHDYNSKPADDLKKVDTTYFSRLELKF